MGVGQSCQQEVAQLELQPGMHVVLHSVSQVSESVEHEQAVAQTEAQLWLHSVLQAMEQLRVLNSTAWNLTSKTPSAQKVRPSAPGTIASPEKLL
jgi:hypothetical protein